MSYFFNAALETYNYYNDSRVQAGLKGKWYKSFDQKSMTVTIELDLYDEEGDYSEDVTFPVHFVVCDGCQGHGKMVNPSIDCGGLSHEELYDDPDFAEAYFGGAYDINCSTCNGNKVVPEITTSGLTEEQEKNLRLFREQQDEKEACFAEMMAELRMGA